MEPVSLILTALAAGASAGAVDSLKDTVKDKSKAAYARLHDLARQRVAVRPYGEPALAGYESAPQKWVGLLRAELTEAGAGSDTELIAAAKALMKLVNESGAKSHKYNVTVRDSKGVQVGDGNVQVNKL